MYYTFIQNTFTQTILVLHSNDEKQVKTVACVADILILRQLWDILYATEKSKITPQKHIEDCYQPKLIFNLQA